MWGREGKCALLKSPHESGILKILIRFLSDDNTGAAPSAFYAGTVPSVRHTLSHLILSKRNL